MNRDWKGRGCKVALTDIELTALLKWHGITKPQDGKFSERREKWRNILERGRLLSLSRIGNLRGKQPWQNFRLSPLQLKRPPQAQAACNLSCHIYQGKPGNYGSIDRGGVTKEGIAEKEEGKRDNEEAKEGDIKNNCYKMTQKFLCYTSPIVLKNQ